MEKYYKEIKLYNVPKVVQNRKKREKTKKKRIVEGIYIMKWNVKAD